MTQTVETPEKEDNQDTHELSESGPMWKKIAQLVGDEELAREVFIQLKDAIQSSAIQNALSTDRRLAHVGTVTRQVVVGLEELNALPGTLRGLAGSSSIRACALRMPISPRFRPAFCVCFLCSSS